MLNFNDITINDKDVITELLGQRKTGTLEEISCEKQFATVFGWRFAHPVQFAKCGEGIVFKYKIENNCLFMFKQPLQDIDKCLKEMMQSCDKCSLSLINLTKTEADYLSEKYDITCTYNEDYSDYLYEAESFRTYSGKKLHSKKNKLNKFLALYGDDFECKQISESVINDCLYICDEWCRDNGCIGSDMRKEIIAARQLLNHYTELSLYGCCLYIKNKPIGFTLGEGLFEGTENSTLVVHCEKAAYDYDGAYPAIAHFFATQHPEFKYINREDDTGDEGLRQSKRSYNPLFLLHKYNAEIPRKKILYE